MWCNVDVDVDVDVNMDMEAKTLFLIALWEDNEKKIENNKRYSLRLWASTRFSFAFKEGICHQVKCPCDTDI